MALWRPLARGLRVLTRRAAADREIDDELRHWIDEATAQHVARGLDPRTARRAALAEIGPPTLVRERVRDHGWEQWVTSWLQDLRLAGRTLRQTPLFTAIVVLVVALGTGAVSTVFSAMNALLLRPVPGVGNPAGVVTLLPARRDGGTSEQIGYARYLHLRDHARTVAGIGAWGRTAMTISTGGAGRAVLGNLVTADYFDLLGIQPARGRFFAAAENRTPGTHPVLVVSDAFWRTHLGADEQAIGRAITVNGHPFTLIGVAPPAFRGLYTGLTVDAWAPLMMQPQLRPRSSLTGGSWLWLFARLRPDVPAPAAQAELSALVDAERRAAGIPDGPDATTSMRALPLTGLPGGSGPALALFAILLGASALVLVIAGVNVAALLAARYSARARDLAVRAALGAGRLRLMRQLLTEVLALFALGAIGGVVLATMATAALERLPLPATIPITLEISPDFRVLAFAVAAALATGVIFGLGPALQGARRDITDRLKAESAGAGRRRSRLGPVLVAGQLALSLVLLVAAGLFVRAVERGEAIDPGIDRHGVTTVQLEPESWGYDERAATAFHAALRDRMAAAPGVTGVAFATRLPLMLSSSFDTVGIGSGRRDVAWRRHRWRLLRCACGCRSCAVVASPTPTSAGHAARSPSSTRPWPGSSPPTATPSAAPCASATSTSPSSASPATPGSSCSSARRRRSSTCRWRSGRTPNGSCWCGPRRPGRGRRSVRRCRRSIRACRPRASRRWTPTAASCCSRSAPPRSSPARWALSAWFWRRSASTAPCRGRWRGGPARSASGWRSARDAARCCGTWSAKGRGWRLAGSRWGCRWRRWRCRCSSAWLVDIDPRDPATYAALAIGLGLVALVASYLPARRAAATDPLRALRTD